MSYPFQIIGDVETILLMMMIRPWCYYFAFSHILFLVRFCLEFSVQRLILCRVILPFCTHYIYPPPTLLSRDNANNFIGSLHIHFSTSFTLKWSMLDTEKPKLVLNMWHKTTKNKNGANLDLIQKHILMWNNKSCNKMSNAKIFFSIL